MKPDTIKTLWEKLLGLIRKIIGPQEEGMSSDTGEIQEAMVAAFIEKNKIALLIKQFKKWRSYHILPFKKMYHFEGGWMSADDMEKEVLSGSEKGDRILQRFKKMIQ